MRIGYGWDSHEFKSGIPLKIGGVTIAHPKGLAGHSDGDVLLHALTDALLGAIAAGDIGAYFPPSDARWKGVDSAVFVQTALEQVRRAGYAVANVDSTLILQEPRIGPHAALIQRRVAELLNIDASAVGVKAKTPEGMGTDNAAIAHVIVLLTKQAGKPRRRTRVLEEVPQPVVDAVAESLLESLEPQKRGKE
ncbi:MAG: 2-C-methyl-D-erythritol 2,4-cyclodiphosphate synthase [Acidobacteriia bacterium]|nr:2-C-methyl-D-erythritol 2,4-cyclodiphosphate synthase [Terriglobia bacterium]